MMTKMAVLEAATDISGTWVDCLKQCLLEVGWTDVSMTDASEMSGIARWYSAWKVLLENLHAYTFNLQNPS
jgi:hypothetical protein